ncbi:MAG: hypothetical protein J6P19_05180, partial [Acetobacter sp.]|nr:hypothetical protein [Acetobacter sp.]
MRLRLRSFLLTSALTFAPAIASATTISGLYVDGGAGYNLVQDQHVHANSPPMSVSGIPLPGYALPKFSVNHGTGFTGFGAVGWGFGNGLRVEAEGLYNFSHDNYTDYANVNNTPYITPNDKALIAKYFPGITVKQGNCSQLLGESEKEFFNGAYGSGSDSHLIPTFQNVMSGGYVPPGMCYGVQAQTQEEATHAFIEASSGNSNIAPGVYYNTGNVPATYHDYTYQSYAQVMRPPFQQVNHHGTDESYGGFFNVIYDFDLERLFGVKSIVTPFIGGGA